MYPTWQGALVASETRRAVSQLLNTSQVIKRANGTRKLISISCSLGTKVSHGTHSGRIIQHNNVHGIITEISRRTCFAFVLRRFILVGAVLASDWLSRTPRTEVTNRACVWDRSGGVLRARTVVALCAIAGR